MRVYTHKSPAERLLDKIDVDWDTGCWLWTASLFKNGYAKLSGRKNPRTVYGHRTSYEAYRGQIPSGLELDHLCRVRKCVNPYHLEAVTRRVNWSRGRNHSLLNLSKTHCPQGHPYSGENLFFARGGGRDCRACKRVQDAEYRDRIRKGMNLNEYRLLYGIKSEKT